MTTHFSLEVVLGDAADDVCQNQLNDAIDGSSNDALVVNAQAVQISLNESDLALAPSRLAAVFVPASLVESSLKEINHGNQKTATTPTSTAFSFIHPADRSKLSDALLALIHPFIAENCAIKAILSIKNKHHAAADLVLLDLSHSTEHDIVDLLEATNSQMIHGSPDAILKIVLLTHLCFTRDDSNSDGDNSSQEQQRRRRRVDISSCPVCLYRIDPLRLGMPVPPNHHLCSKFCPPPNLAMTDVARQLGGNADCPCPRQRCLQPWAAPSHCAACHIIQTYWKEQESANDESSDLFCCQCAMQETLWVCLTCGFVGCGRYSNKHAADHFVESRHPHSLELATLRIWDYVTGEFAHRTDLLECPSSPPLVFPWIRRPRSASRSMLPPVDSSSSNNNGSGARPPLSGGRQPPISNTEKTPKKATMIGEEYEALLQSALEDQAQHYEGEIMRLRAALTAEQVDAESMTKAELEETESIKTEIAELRAEIDRVSRGLLDSQAQEAGYRATSQRLLREQQVSQDMLKKLREDISREHAQGNMQVEELELQIADLTANFRMRDQFSGELSNAQIYGTTGNEAKPNKKGGKKSRRFFRK
jgi:hypothetical protein